MSTLFRHAKVRRDITSCPALLTFIFIIAMSFLCQVRAANAEVSAPTVYQVKAAFFYNFTKYVELPDRVLSNYNGPLNMCIIGDDPIVESLGSIGEKTVNNRPLLIRHLKGLGEIGQCHYLFISESEQEQLPEILRRSAQKGILTVSDIEDFTRSGGMVGFITVNKKIRFSVNLRAAQKTGIRISSQLLKLAVEVEGNH